MVVGVYKHNYQEQRKTYTISLGYYLRISQYFSTFAVEMPIRGNQHAYERRDKKESECESHGETEETSQI